jgi:hypothetical protein
MRRTYDTSVPAARDLVGATYAALGTADAEGDGFSRFITAGMSDELIDAIGPLPRTHGLLGSLLVDPTPYRSEDVATDPRFTWWPSAHPRMHSFLGVPIVFKGDVIGALYLADKQGASTFDEADERLLSLLAAHAAVAMEQARLLEASRELSVAEERARLARELHDATVQTLFSLSLRAETRAATTGAATRGPTAASTGISRWRCCGSSRRPGQRRSPCPGPPHRCHRRAGGRLSGDRGGRRRRGLRPRGPVDVSPAPRAHLDARTGRGPGRQPVHRLGGGAGGRSRHEGAGGGASWLRFPQTTSSPT